jgi:hypothetical protein
MRAQSFFGLLLSTLIGASGCKTTTHAIALGPRYREIDLPPRAARIVVVWPSNQWAGSGVQARVLVGGHDIGRIEPLGYIDAVVDPPETSVAVRFKYVNDGVTREVGQNLFVEYLSGETIYVEYSVAGGLFEPQLHLRQMKPDEGRLSASQTRRTVSP